MATDTGGPAHYKTLLDEFAGKALAGIETDGRQDLTVTKAAAIAYAMAEAMIAEKRKREQE